ncbi:MAG: M1 family metallopeptidase [Solirubrobacterales bacterium]|nr:M1 family metallopeptidase [Solirubrobacterales bacterium]
MNGSPDRDPPPGAAVCDDPGIARRLLIGTPALLATATTILGLCLPASAGAAFTPGATTLGDPLFPQIGNGGYDVGHYDIALNYAPATNSLGAGTVTTIAAVATQDLSSFTFDFQPDLQISGVTIDGHAATFNQRDAKPRLSRNPKVTQPGKLIIVPPAGIATGSNFVVKVTYSGVPEPITDADVSIEGWVRACSTPGNCDGSFTVNEPIGAQSWFPCNNYMTDKATVSTEITVPNGYTALGTGELASCVAGPGETTTWSWTEDDPTATYLTSASVGRFEYDDSQTLFDPTGSVTLPIYAAIDSAGPASAKDEVRDAASQIPSGINFLSRRFGPYPFDSVGYVADWVPAVGYALENQTKPHFAGDKRGPVVDPGELVHELAHQWMGNDVTARTWQEIWFNEGWATFAEIYFDARVNGGESPKKFFRTVIRSKGKNFRIAPADLGSAANLFSGFPVYSRPGAMLEGYREIVGSKRFFAFARALTTEHAYSTISERPFVNAAVNGSGLRPNAAGKLRTYFRQWLHREGKPTLTPADFRR